MFAATRPGSFLGAFAVLGALASCLLLPSGARAEDTAGEWRNTVVIYGMGAAIDGTAQIGPVTVPVDVGISDLFDALEFGAMAAWRIENDIWSFTADTTFMGLGGSGTTEGGLLRGEMDVDQFTLMGTLGRRVTPHLEALLGGRKLIAQSAPVETERASLVALDACLGVPGTPQSATGQATLLTGRNVPAEIGYHYGPKPNPEVAAYLRSSNGTHGGNLFL